MKRDMDLIRDILLRYEAADKAYNGYKVLEGLGEEPVLKGHLTLLEDAGFVQAHITETFAGGARLHSGWRITWEGHDFLETVRDPEIWRKTKDGAKSVGGWSVTLLAELGKGYLRQKAIELGLPIG